MAQNIIKVDVSDAFRALIATRVNACISFECSNHDIDEVSGCRLRSITIRAGKCEQYEPREKGQDE